ncbi:MAG: hypothetical protein CL814_11250 [Confluentimicrobium sp.]|jgi:uncharacterized protein|uniref:DUF192 domain-containing protein n=1 Tax=Actibacterium sp. TaxID=1872125 RepID=UPI000C3CE4A5|nr:DUF192 domain-containing protein [Actibacterium sp.]MBC57494.1 hypothetical protein [Actibacterium sp.]MDY6858012.1 DUF192 domain-containing protein [Pseudomonadota bacterium]
MGKRDQQRQHTGWRRRLSAFLALLAVIAATPLAAACTDGSVDLRGGWGQARFTVELADDPAERSRGLMFRETLPASHGMLFVYDHPQHAVFWMKNTLIPLDMLFIDPQGRVRRIHENAIPHDTTQIDGGPGVLAVLEINGGLSRRLGITEGSVLRHPAFGPDAAWPCDAP